MKIGIIGAGNVGGTLGKRWAKNGHQVTFAYRSSPPETLLRESGPTAKAATPAETARSSDVLLLATPWENAEDALKGCGDLSGKTVIDATNPLLPGLAGLALGTTTSAAERVAALAPGAKVVKAFNTVGANVMADPAFPQGRTTMFYCGDDAAAKDAVAGLISELGFDPVDAGPLTQARLLEPFAMLWISLALQRGQGREIALQLIKRSKA